MLLQNIFRDLELKTSRDRSILKHTDTIGMTYKEYYDK